jgi:glycosyltransferase involved in cell wall biosynthesis
MVSIAAWLAGVPLTYVRVAGSPLRDRRTRWKSTILAHLARPFCRGEIAVSESVQNQLIEGLGLPGSRVHLIPNGCDIDAIEQRAAAARATRQSAGPRRIIMVSRMDDAKDHPVLLSAMKLLWAEGCDSQLTLVGNGPMRQEHESIALGLGLSGAVRFLENRTDVPELIGSSDVLTHPTHTEGFPNVLIEAMAARVPIVATDIPPCREILGNGTCGVLVPPRDPEALALAIRRVLEDASLRQQITGAAAQRVRALYDIRVAVERYAQLLAVP